jgi:3-hydroxybutyryl-CoA dehydrogenase
MKAKDIQRVAVIGAGTMGEGIVQIFAQSGFSVNVVEKEPLIIERCLNQIKSNLKLFRKSGLITENLSTIMSRISTFTSERLTEAVKDSQFVIETVVEILEVKKAVFAQLDLLPKEVILASNSSSITVSDLTKGMKTPERVVGLHFFNPASIIPLVEVHRSQNTSEQAIQTTREIIERTGKKTVLVRKEIPGFIINRLTGAMEREIDYLLDEGVVTPEDLDEAVKASFGFRLSCIGPMEAEDMIGLDIAARVSDKIYKTLSNRTDAAPSVLEKVKKGELGIKSGKGWYDYSGKTREQALAEKNTVLLQQLKLFQSRQKNNP